MQAATLLTTLGLTSALIVDDAYAMPRSEDISDERIGQLRDAILDQDERAALMLRRFGVAFQEICGKGFSAKAQDHLVQLVRDKTLLAELFQATEEQPEFGWAKPLFDDYRTVIEGKHDDLRALEEYLRAAGIVPITQASIKPDDPVLLTAAIVFLDFFLVDGETGEQALRRVSDIGKNFVAPRSISGRRIRPLLFLISSRPQARDYKEEFRRAINLKSPFFRFVPKRDLSDSAAIDSRLADVLNGYQLAIPLADFLDALRTAATIAFDEVSARFDRLELADLTLLHALRLEADNEELGTYLAWLMGESISSSMQGNRDIKAMGRAINQIGQFPLDGHIEPKMELFDVYSRAVFRYDVRDPAVGTRDPITFGDVFRRQPPGNGVDYVVLMTPSCDVARCLAEQRVLCLNGRAGEPIADLKAFISDPPFGKQKHLIELVNAAGDVEHRIVIWDLKSCETVQFRDLCDPVRYHRVARLHPLFALELQAEFLAVLARVGVPLHPSPVKAYEATVRLVTKADPIKEATFSTHDEGMYAAITASKRTADREHEIVRFTQAFIDRLSSFIRGTILDNHADWQKWKQILELCDSGALIELPLKNRAANAANGNVRIIFQQHEEEKSQGLCTISLY